jgi:hypothetical protein
MGKGPPRSPLPVLGRSAIPAHRAPPRPRPTQRAPLSPAAASPPRPASVAQQRSSLASPAPQTLAPPPARARPVAPSPSRRRAPCSPSAHVARPPCPRRQKPPMSVPMPTRPSPSSPWPRAWPSRASTPAQRALASSDDPRAAMRASQAWRRGTPCRAPALVAPMVPASRPSPTRAEHHHAGSRAVVCRAAVHAPVGHR